MHEYFSNSSLGILKRLPQTGGVGLGKHPSSTVVTLLVIELFLN
jgi:hypothetical protein